MNLVKTIPTNNNEVFLTFDDGPDPHLTLSILEILDRLNSKGTFFMVAQSVEKYPQIAKEVIARGHQIGNHSLDHTYGVFFRGEEELKTWILKSHEKISSIVNKECVGFRSPAGVVTPPLKRVMSQLNIPWIHWNKRYFDTSFPFKWTQAFHNLQTGDIVLLHDRQRSWMRNSFIQVLDQFINNQLEKGMTFSEITKERLCNV